MTPRFYLGLACSGHDNAVAIVSDEGEVVFAEAVERSLQSKRGLLAPPDGIFQTRRLIAEHCPDDAEIVIAKSWSDRAPAHLDALDQRAAEHEAMLARYASLGFGPHELGAYRYLLQMGAAYIGLAGKTAEAYLRQERGQADVEVRAYDHHLTHAASGCFTAPFARAACLVVDGLGEDGSTRAYTFDEGALAELGPPRREAEWIGSLGFFFMEVCTLCGFDPTAGEEWKVMGLAAYGRRDPRVYDLMRQTIATDGLAVTRPVGALKASAALRALRREPGTDPMVAADLAHTGQLVFEELMGELLASLHARGVSSNLVLGGGCALNSAFNGKLVTSSPFEALHVFNAPADDGNAVGAALLAWREDHPDAGWAPRPLSPYLGSELSRASLDAIAAGGALSVERLSPEQTIAQAAARLDAGQIVGWAHGRAELGPRALGHRSILADPRRPEMKARINAAVKHREAFRPFAPAVLHAHGPEWFDPYEDSPFMERALPFRAEVSGRVPAVAHEDGTGRLQSVTRERDPRFFELLSAFHERTSVPILLNTSLNVMGKPIVHSVEDAVALFATSALDAMFLEDLLLTKPS